MRNCKQIAQNLMLLVKIIKQRFKMQRKIMTVTQNQKMTTRINIEENRKLMGKMMMEMIIMISMKNKELKEIHLKMKTNN